MSLEIGARAGRTIVERVLGTGGMATVYLVRHEELGSLFALKVLDLVTVHLSRRFAAEGRMQASLRHPNVVAVYDVLEVDGRPALLLEYVDGRTLSQWMDTPHDLEEIEWVFRQVVAGVAAAHEAGLVHRDLKPANVLLAQGPEGLVAKVADFGVAKHVATEGVTRTGLGIGTPGYMAPEQIRDAKNVDGRADVFALGVLLYELVCGFRPFRGGDTVDIIQAVTSGRYTPAREVQPDLPARIDEAIRGCLVPDPARRLPDCQALLETLDGTRTQEAASDTWVQVVPGDPAAVGSSTPVRAQTLSPESTAGATAWGQLPTGLETEGAGVGKTLVAPSSHADTADGPPPTPDGSRLGQAVGVAVVLTGVVGLALTTWWLLPSAPARPDTPAPSTLTSVVVRPYAVDGEDNAEWLGTALAEDLTFALAGAGGPRVVSQSALDRYDGVPSPAALGTDLGVEAVLEGRVRMMGDRVQVQTSLVRVADASVVWTDTRSGPIGAVSGPNGTVAGAVLTAFDLASLPRTEAPDRLAAQADYLLGREIVRAYQESRYDQAEAALLRAIQTDPTFVAARTTLARLYLHRGWHGAYADTDTVALAEAQIRQALAHAPTDPQALQVLGRSMVLRGELRSAVEMLNLAIQQGDVTPDAYIDRYEAEVRAGAMELARADLDRAEALDPYYLRVYTNQAWLTTYSGHFGDLDAVLDRARAHSVDHPSLQRARGESLRRTGQDDALRTHLAAHPDELVQALADRDEAWLEAQVLQMRPLGPERPNGVIERARYEAALGRTEQSLASLRIALAAYPGYLCHLEDPLFDKVKQHPDWPALKAASQAESDALRRAFAAVQAP